MESCQKTIIVFELHIQWTALCNCIGLAAVVYFTEWCMMGCGMPCVQGGGLHQHVVGLRCNADMHWVS